MQVQGTVGIDKYSNLTNSLRLIYAEEGARGMFRGLGPALMTVPLFWGIYFYSYEYMKVKLSEYETRKAPQLLPVHGKPPIQAEPQSKFTLPPTVVHITAAVAAGAVGDIICNPLWVLRTRIQTLVLHDINTLLAYTSAPLASLHDYKSVGVMEMTKQIYKNEGIRAFYKGLNASFLGLSHVAVQFPLYERLKQFARERRGDQKESVYDLIVASISSKYVATLITYPHEVIRARMQDQRIIDCPSSTTSSSASRSSLRYIVRHMIATEGIGSLWAGLRVNLVRVIPSTLSTFLCYEYMSRYLQETL